MIWCEGDGFSSNIICTAVATAASNTCRSTLTLAIRTTSSTDGYLYCFTEVRCVAETRLCYVAWLGYAGDKLIEGTALAD
jgi:hypothetical protein